MVHVSKRMHMRHRNLSLMCNSNNGSEHTSQGASVLQGGRNVHIAPLSAVHAYMHAPNLTAHIGSRWLQYKLGMTAPPSIREGVGTLAPCKESHRFVDVAFQQLYARTIRRICLVDVVQKLPQVPAATPCDLDV